MISLFRNNIWWNTKHEIGSDANFLLVNNHFKNLLEKVFLFCCLQENIISRRKENVKLHTHTHTQIWPGIRGATKSTRKKKEETYQQIN